ncbi:MAG: Holliday junction branch migration protein RuvA [Anaerolinea sp.]|nr:Holliday junction branch migration protein RuvA [Anaerolinea sp.]
MIAALEGQIAATLEDGLLVMVGGIGLHVHTPAALRLQAVAGQRILLHTHLVVREDLLALYGFETVTERDTFVLLLGVEGIGPRLGLAVLSTLSVDAIRRAVFHEQAEVFARVPGIGKKTAAKILLHLQGKLGSSSELGLVTGLPDADTEVLEALTALGYSVVEAQAAIQSIPRDAPADVDVRLRLALQYFS